MSEFASAIATMLNSSLKNPNNEEFQKNCIRDFLRDSFGYSCNTRGKVDLAIYDDDIPKVLFEVKSLSNKAEFVKSPKDLSSKALYESILYYLREFHKYKNNDIKHIILCTAHEFYFINAKAYHKLFVSNTDKAIQKHIDTAYSNCGKKQGTGNDTSTSKFYAEIEAILLDIDATLEFCYVNVANLADNKSAKNPRDLALFYALLSPSVLLQIPRYIDANTLNERFYKELLYILGLVQVEQEGKALILPSTTPNTLLHSIKHDFADKLPRDLSESQNPSNSNALDSRQNISNSPKSTQNPSHPQDSQNPSQDSKHTQNPNDSQTSHDSADIFDSHILPLITLWNNRILFLRLLESMLLSFKHIEKPFLHISILHDFGAINTLFFKVLAVKERTDIPPNLANIPYLNSSLFEKSALELQGFEIASLESRPLKIAPDSILRRDKTLRERYIGKDEQLPLLEYLFAFLHAYDFTTTPSDVQNYAKTNHDKLINSAVLGLVFEKLNGYKEGSFYTPSFITRYMCESSIRKIVVDKFNSTNPQWQCKTLADIEYEIHREIRQARNTPDSSSRGSEAIHKIDTHPLAPSAREGESLDCHDLKSPLPCGGDLGVGKSTQRADSNNSTKEILSKYNKIFLSIRICDPAVGSGHFLVSALNELIAIKHELGLLLDCDGRRLSDIDLVLENDELLIKDSQGQMLDYTIPAHERIEAHKIQKALFYTKKEIIENCLFGVDINPNSVEICKLRLWIELLKYSYYENIATKELQTLPNIDINIKCGNSLVSLFEFNESDEKGNPKPYTLKWLKNQNSEFSQNFREKLLRYNDLVQTYKEKLGDKQAITKEIESIKSYFKTTLLDNSFVSKQMRDKLKNFIEIYGDEVFDIGTPFGMEMIKIIRNNKGKGFQFIPTIQSKSDTLEVSTPKEIDKQGRKILDSIKADFDNIQSIKEQQTFEWRFEFPEVLDLQSLQSKQEKAKLHNAQKRAGQKPKSNELDSIGDFMGFDLIIGNPPYIKEADNKRLFENTKKLRTYQGKMDIWYHFVGKGFDLVKNQGIATFIATNNWTTNAGAQKLRNVILNESQILNLVDFGSYMCFDSASIQTMIMEFRKSNAIPKSYTINYAKIESKKPTDEHRKAVLKREIFDDNIYLTPTITPKKLLDKTLNFVDSDKDLVLNKIIKNGKFYFEDSEIQIGIGLTDKVKKKMGLTNHKAGEGIFQLSTQELQNLNLSKKEKNLIKPLYTTNELSKFFGNPKNTEWVIYTDSSFKNPNSMDNYPNIKRHLDEFKSVITSDNKPYGLHRAKQERFFNKTPSIVSLRKCPIEPIFTYVDFDCYVTSTFFIIQTNRIDMKYLIGILNSKLVAFWLKHKGKMQGNNYQIDKEPLLNIPILEPNAKNQKIADKIVNLVDKILQSKAQGKNSTTTPYPNATPPCHTTPHPCHTERSEVSQKQKRDFSHSTNAQNDKIINDLESQIDDLVYQLYDLTHDEIQIIESK